MDQTNPEHHQSLGYQDIRDQNNTAKHCGTRSQSTGCGFKSRPAHCALGKIWRRPSAERFQRDSRSFDATNLGPLVPRDE